MPILEDGSGEKIVLKPSGLRQKRKCQEEGSYIHTCYLLVGPLIVAYAQKRDACPGLIWGSG
jgi:hypothetical protein